MRLRQHVTSIVMIVVAIVAGIWVLIDRGKVTDRERQDRAHDVFPAYRRGDIDGFELIQGETKLATLAASRSRRRR